MKTNRILCLSFAAFTLLSPELSAQSFLKKALNKVDNLINKGANAVDGLLGSPTEAASQTAGYEKAQLKSFSTSVDLAIESCIYDGKMLTLTFSLNNRGKALSFGNFGGKKGLLTSADTKFYDANGNTYDIAYVQIGATVRPFNTGGAYFTLPEGTKVRGQIGISKFDRTATALKSLTVAGYLLDESKAENNGKYTPISLSMRDVPVYTSEQLLGAPKKIWTRENPQVGQSAAQCAIQSVVLTEQNTQVRFAYTGQVGYIYAENWANTYIQIGAQRYALRQTYGIAQHKELTGYHTGGTQQIFTLVFDQIPENTKTFNLQFDDWKWTNVSVEPPAPLSLVLTPQGIGELKRDRLTSTLPARSAGLYDRIEKETDADMGDMFTSYVFYLGTEKIIECNERDGRIIDFCLYSSKFSTPQGFRTGMSIQEILKKKGVRLILRNHEVCITIDGYTMGYSYEDLTAAGNKAFTDAYLKGKDPAFSTLYFKTGAKVMYITI